MSEDDLKVFVKGTERFFSQVTATAAEVSTPFVPQGAAADAGTAVKSVTVASETTVSPPSSATVTNAVRRVRFNPDKSTFREWDMVHPPADGRAFDRELTLVIARVGRNHCRQADPHTWAASLSP